VVFQLGVGLALVLALLLSVCDVMVGIGLVRMMLWEALRAVVVLAFFVVGVQCYGSDRVGDTDDALGGLKSGCERETGPVHRQD